MLVIVQCFQYFHLLISFPSCNASTPLNVTLILFGLSWIEVSSRNPKTAKPYRIKGKKRASFFLKYPMHCLVFFHSVCMVFHMGRSLPSLKSSNLHYMYNRFRVHIFYCILYSHAFSRYFFNHIILFFVIQLYI